MREKKSIQNWKQLIEIPNAWPNDSLKLGSNILLSLIELDCTYMENEQERFVGFVMIVKCPRVAADSK
jgi:TATA-box binding protein (TBP) (component of TFIID and TFIIIB)